MYRSTVRIWIPSTIIYLLHRFTAKTRHFNMEM